MLSTYGIQFLNWVSNWHVCGKVFLFLLQLSEGSMRKEGVSQMFVFKEGIHLKGVTTAQLKEMDKTTMQAIL